MRILVTGATGNIGRLVVDHLLAAGASEVRALTTNPAKAALPAGVEVAEGYVRKPATLPATLEGVERMYLAPTPETVEEVVALAGDAGVKRIVDLSGELDSHWGTVAGAVEASGVEWTHLAPGEFMENTHGWAEQIQQTGVVRDGYAASANAPICMDDVAAVAAVALLEDGHAGRTLGLTGPESLSRAELVRQIAEALGSEIPYVELSHEETIAQLAPSMGEFAEWYVAGMADLVEHPQLPSSTFEEVTGRPGTRFATWAARNVEWFRV